MITCFFLVLFLLLITFFLCHTLEFFHSACFVFQKSLLQIQCRYMPWIPASIGHDRLPLKNELSQASGREQPFLLSEWWLSGGGSRSPTHPLWASGAGMWLSFFLAGSEVCFCSVCCLPHEFFRICLSWLSCKFDCSLFLKVFHKFTEVHNILEGNYLLSTKIPIANFILVQTVCRCLSIFVLHLGVNVQEFAKLNTQERDYYAMQIVFQGDYIFQHLLASVSIALYDIQIYWLTL